MVDDHALPDTGRLPPRADGVEKTGHEQSLKQSMSMGRYA